MENHHAIDGKPHYVDWAIFNSKLLVIPRGYLSWDHLTGGLSQNRLIFRFSLLKKIFVRVMTRSEKDMGVSHCRVRLRVLHIHGVTS